MKDLIDENVFLNFKWTILNWNERETLYSKYKNINFIVYNQNIIQPEQNKFILSFIYDPIADVKTFVDTLKIKINTSLKNNGKIIFVLKNYNNFVQILKDNLNVQNVFFHKSIKTDPYLIIIYKYDIDSDKSDEIVISQKSSEYTIDSLKFQFENKQKLLINSIIKLSKNKNFMSSRPIKVL